MTMGATMTNEPSGDYYDYTKTMKPERPWHLQWHQKYVWRIMHARRGGTGTYSADPEMAAARPADCRYIFGDGQIAALYLTFEDALDAIKRVHDITCGVPQIVLLTGWQFEGHDSKYPAWSEVNRHLKRPQDETAIQSLRWLIREARRYNCLATLHLNMFDAYADSPLFEEYVEKDIIARDKDGKLIVGNRWSGMDCYHVSYTQEWQHGLTQKRIDGLLEMIPEIRENHCIYLDAFLGSRKADQKGVISPYLEHSREDECRTQRKILRYWHQNGVDPACEHVTGLGDDRFVGLQAHSACQDNLIEDVPDELYCSNPAHFGFTSVTEPEGFADRFWLDFLPWFYKNNPDGTEDPKSMIDGTDLCMAALWCDRPTLIAHSRDGYQSKTWKLPADWRNVDTVAVAPLPIGQSKAETTIPAHDGTVSLKLSAGQTVRITPA